MMIPTFNSMSWLPYRIVRRLAIANVNYICGSTTDELSQLSLPAGYAIQSCSSQQLEEHAGALEYKFSTQDLSMLASGDYRCFSAFQNESLVGYAWVAFGEVRASANHGGKAETGLPIKLADDTAFVFNVYVLPGHRGCRLYAAIIGQMATALQKESIKKFVLTTEVTNESALRAIKRMGLKKLAQVSFFKIGPLSKAAYPRLPGDCGFTIGRYAGDLSGPDPA